MSWVDDQTSSDGSCWKEMVEQLIVLYCLLRDSIFDVVDNGFHRKGVDFNANEIILTGC